MFCEILFDVKVLMGCQSMVSKIIMSQARRKGLFRVYANSKDPDQPAKLQHQLRAFLNP